MKIPIWKNNRRNAAYMQHVMYLQKKVFQILLLSILTLSTEYASLNQTDASMLVGW